MKILSLFDGMACGMIAMLNAGVEVESYDAYEIDKYAIKVSSYNFPNIRQHGDVFLADFTQHEGVDFLIGGSPCTHWSIARLGGRETKASGVGWELFSQYVRAVKEAKPKFFIYENNKSMSDEIRESIDRAFGFESVCINSALVSAQNRQRLYWVGIRNPDGTYSKVPVDQPEDRGVLLRDILVTGEPINTTVGGDKARTCMAGYYKYGTATLLTNPGFTGGTTAVAEPVPFVLGKLPDAANKFGHIPQMWNPYNNAEITDKMPTLTTCCGSQTSSSSLMIFDEAGAIVELDKDGKPTKARSRADGKVHTVYEVKDGQITIKGKQYPIKLADGFYIIRKLIITECMRLQTVPEWYDFSVISDSQAYKCLGNGWTCDVITHLSKATQEEKVNENYVR